MQTLGKTYLRMHPTGSPLCQVISVLWLPTMLCFRPQCGVDDMLLLFPCGHTGMAPIIGIEPSFGLISPSYRRMLLLNTAHRTEDL
jgi:hypothetical protein